MMRHIWRTRVDLRRRLYEILEHGAIGDRAGLIVGRLIVVLIVVNLVAMTLDSVPALQAQYEPLFTAIELLSLVLFTIEYGLRVWVAVEHVPHRPSSERKARWKFITSPLGMVDLLAVLPFWLALVLPIDLRVLLVFRMARFLKLARYSPAMRSLLDALYNERRALFGCFVILLGATLLAASIMHVIERHVQPDKFGTIPDAMWWAIVTLGTIGYGDVVPVTALGRVVAAVTIFVGLIMVALPIGIVATAFADEIHRRDFVVTWGMVARVPLFAELQATHVLMDREPRIAEHIREVARTRLGGDVVTRKGDLVMEELEEAETLDQSADSPSRS